MKNNMVDAEYRAGTYPAPIPIYFLLVTGT